MIEIDISELCDYVILIGGLVVAIKNIYDFTAKPTSYFKRKKIQKEEEWHSAYLAKKLPEMLVQHDLQIREKYKADRMNYLKEIKQEVTSELIPQIEEIRQINMNQNQIIETLAKSSRDVLREKIMVIYHKNKRNKSLTLYEKEALDQYFKDYKAEGGNNYIDKYYGRMKTWQVLDEDYED